MLAGTLSFVITLYRLFSTKNNIYTEIVPLFILRNISIFLSVTAVVFSLCFLDIINGCPNVLDPFPTWLEVWFVSIELAISGALLSCITVIFLELVFPNNRVVDEENYPNRCLMSYHRKRKIIIVITWLATILTMVISFLIVVFIPNC